MQLANVCLRVSKTHFQQNLIFGGFLKEWMRFIACHMKQQKIYKQNLVRFEKT